MFVKETRSNANESLPHCHAATITLTPSGDVLAAWYTYPEEETRGGVLMLAREPAGRIHFFGQAPVSKNHEQTEFPKMVRMLGHASKVLAGTDVKVYNCSPDSNLDCFERVSHEWAVAQ